MSKPLTDRFEVDAGFEQMNSRRVMYLVAIIDWFSRYVVSWELDDTLEMQFVLSAVDRALGIAKPLIWNSDQGSHFTSPLYIDRLKPLGIEISMDGRGRGLDNVFTERLWRSVKYEEVYLNEYTSPRDALRGISRYFAFYNAERPHQSLAYQTPAQLYAAKLRYRHQVIRSIHTSHSPDCYHRLKKRKEYPPTIKSPKKCLDNGVHFNLPRPGNRLFGVVASSRHKPLQVASARLSRSRCLDFAAFQTPAKSRCCGIVSHVDSADFVAVQRVVYAAPPSASLDRSLSICG
jgi:putative transposase